jgi:hypothetical protein
MIGLHLGIAVSWPQEWFEQISCRGNIDAFSGRANPSFILTGSDADDLLRDLAHNRGALTGRDAGYTGLGFRGVQVELLSDELATALDLPGEFKVGGGSSQNDSKGFELAERIIRSLRKYPSSSPLTDTPIPFDQGLEQYLLKLFKQAAPGYSQTTTDGGPVPVAPQDVTCQIEKGKFNPGFWNTPSVQPYNNCYNYASNWKTNTFAQPGRGAGSQYTALTCAEVTRAALADGCHRRYDCFPDAEKPRWVMALVVAPGQDYHWYRWQQEGFWGHKPGGTAAKNTDNNGNVVMNPETCVRAPYTDFCGYFYSCKTRQHRIKRAPTGEPGGEACASKSICSVVAPTRPGRQRRRKRSASARRCTGCVPDRACPNRSGWGSAASS